jgi:HlyD family secretion protein
MDIQLEKKKGLQKKHIPYVLGGALVLLFAGWMIFADHSSSYKADARTVTVSEVAYGEFNDYVRVNGNVQPITTVQLGPMEGGIVDQIVVEEGSSVRRGEVIVILSNPNLSLEILESEANLAEKQNLLRNTQVTMEQQKLDLQRQQLQIDLDVTRKFRAFQQKERLHAENLIPREEYLQAKEDYELAERQKNLNRESQMQDSIYRSVQVQQMEDDLTNMRRNMELIRQRVDNLQVRSPIDGELGLLDVVLGQSVASGQKIGQINDLSDFKIEAAIDEHYIDQVVTGLPATFERQSSTFDLTVRRVYPEVRNGQFKTDFVFRGERPENIRTGQTYYINLELGEPTESVIIPRGAFYQTTGGNWIFVVAPDGGRAYKREIRIRRQNPQFYEVVEGLEPGEKVITSSYDSFGNNEVIILQ